jgi:hypothetical protein
MKIRLSICPISPSTNHLFLSSTWVVGRLPLGTRRLEEGRNVCGRLELLHRFSDTLLPSTLATAGLPGDDDPAAKMWALSISHATQHDDAMIDRWKNDMDGILVYVRCKLIHRRLRLLEHLSLDQRSIDRYILSNSCRVSH